MGFQNIIGLYLLSFLVPLIILYLIKAKPKNVLIPSLQFFTNDVKAKTYNSILQKFLLRLLFLLQLLFIILIAFSAANPVITLPIDANSLSTIVIMDVSASMMADNRMDAGKQDLLKQIKGRTSIILAQDNPVVLASNVSSSRARALISSIQSRDTSTRLDGSILLANELLEKNGNIIVYSDFLLEKDDDVLSAKKIAEANDKKVTLMQTGKPTSNIGFISLNINRGIGEALVKNFNDKNQVVDIKLVSKEKQDSTRIEIRPYSVEQITFNIGQGETSIEIAKKDSMEADNKVSVMNPFESKTSILVISNKKKTPLVDALQSNAQFDVEVTIPPVIPDLKHDVVIVNEVDRNALLPNTFREIKKYKDKGGYVIITAQDDMNKINFQNLLNFRIGSVIPAQTQACVDVVNQFTSRISSPKCFASVRRVFEISNNSVALAKTKEGNAIFVLEDNLFYYGIVDTYSDFKEQINYPLFWDDLINSLLGKESISHFNFRTGDLYLKGNLTEKVVLDRVGIHEINNKKIAANILNERESDLFRDPLLNTTEINSQYQKIPLELNIHVYLLLLGILIFAFELYYIKRRGDL